MVRTCIIYHCGRRKKGGESAKWFATFLSQRYDLWLYWVVDLGFLKGRFY